MWQCVRRSRMAAHATDCLLLRAPSAGRGITDDATLKDCNFSEDGIEMLWLGDCACKVTQVCGERLQHMSALVLGALYALSKSDCST